MAHVTQPRAPAVLAPQRRSTSLRACMCTLQLALLLPLGWRHAGVSAYPACNDSLAAAGAPYVRLFAEPRDFGRPGLSHVTLHGAVQHGAREVEVWQQAFAPQAGTPIHRHDCEEVFIVLAGSGTLRVREIAGHDVRHLPFRANSTLVVQPNIVHQIVNTGVELLQLTVVISRPPIRVFVYNSWETPDAQATPRIPYLFDRECLPADKQLDDPAPPLSGAGEL